MKEIETSKDDLMKSLKKYLQNGSAISVQGDSQIFGDAPVVMYSRPKGSFMPENNEEEKFYDAVEEEEKQLPTDRNADEETPQKKINSTPTVKSYHSPIKEKVTALLIHSHRQSQ